MKLNMEVEACIIAAVGRRLMQRQHIRKRHLPQVVELDENVFQRMGQIADFGVGQVSHTAMGSLRRDIDFIRIAGEIGQERDCRVVLKQQP